MYNPINRTITQIEENKFKLYFNEGPVNYKTDDGTYEPIDLQFEDKNIALGSIKLLRKNIFSVGVRKDNNPHKFFGLRPDNCQSGEKQLEFTVVNVELDGEKQDIDLNNDFDIRIHGAQLLKYYKVPKKFKDFKIEFDIHSTGLTLINNKYTDNNVARPSYSCDIVELGEDTGSNIVDNYYNDTDLKKEDPFIKVYTGKITDDYIVTADTYSREEEFGSDSLDDYTLGLNLPQGSSHYFKNAIVMYMKSYNIDGFESIIINKIKKLLDVEYYDDQGYGKHFTKDGKKIGGISADDEHAMIWINTEDIPGKVKTLFKRKTFNDTSFLDIDLNTFTNKIKEGFDYSYDAVNVDSNYYQGQEFRFLINKHSFYIKKPVLANSTFGDLRAPTSHTLKDNGDGTFRYTKYMNIESSLMDLDISYIDINISAGASNHQHTATTNTTKLGSPTFATSNNDAGLLNFVRNSQTFPSGQYSKCSAQTLAHDSGLEQISFHGSVKASHVSGGTGQNTDLTDGSGNNDCITIVGINKGKTSSTLATTWQNHKFAANIGLDTSSIATCTAANFKWWGCAETGEKASFGIHINTYPTDIDVDYIYLKGSFPDITPEYTINHTLATGAPTIPSGEAKYNDFEGWTSGWTSSDVTQYSSMISYTPDQGPLGGGQNPKHTTVGVMTDALNATACTDIANNDDFKIHIMGKEFYNNSYETEFGERGGGSTATGIGIGLVSQYRALNVKTFNNSDTSKRPYLEVTGTIHEVATATGNAGFFGANF